MFFPAAAFVGPCFEGTFYGPQGLQDGAPQF